MLYYTSILLDIRFILIHLFLFRPQIYCKKRNKALVYVPKNLFHVPILFQSPQKSIFKTLYLQVLPEIAISVVVWIDNHLLFSHLVFREHPCRYQTSERRWK